MSVLWTAEEYEAEIARLTAALDRALQQRGEAIAAFRQERARVNRVEMQGLRPIDLKHAGRDCACSGVTLEASCVATTLRAALADEGARP